MKQVKINKSLIKNRQYKDFKEILDEKLEKLNWNLKNWKYYLEIKKDYFWLYLKKYSDGIIYQSLVFRSDLEIINWINWNINFYENQKINF